MFRWMYVCTRSAALRVCSVIRLSSTVFFEAEHGMAPGQVESQDTQGPIVAAVEVCTHDVVI